MKKGKFMLVFLGIVAAGLLSFSVLRSGSVKGTITPPEGALKVWVISSTDTLNGNITNGYFTIRNVKPGTYKVMVEATPPFKNVTKDAVDIKDGEITDVGEIKLQQ